eukprot:CAMPEP_0206008740 /NCGR_PEP_ID=MMETSP1464-20131121/8259_1 /ASSEMBLY_ACC=CAM_ASM_001124 /TAXON_ID=119497 /ORGANISM="Exanthemachrysis gayraliae, Strain RCC1523" /LENGTH=50 /DNA_ID=CAMNT_0053382299 /DNA_START=263 /DNA_END=412 /DNA_ORIENTATION=-
MPNTPLARSKSHALAAGCHSRPCAEVRGVAKTASKQPAGQDAWRGGHAGP